MNAIKSIIIRPEKRGLVHHVTSAKILGHGIEGDHYGKPEGHRHVTLIAADDLATVAVIIEFQGDAHAACRRNVCVDTLPDGDLTGRQISLGHDVIVEVTGYCTPCNRMNENFGAGAVEAFSKRAGWTAKVIREGQIMIGDPVAVG